ncbi:MAG TPA: NAD-dependent dehydratase [Edaphobacter sp.]
MKLLLLGATGLVGRNTLALALQHPKIELVVAPTRRPLQPHGKLLNPVASRLEDLLPELSSQSFDAMICATGTTMKKAGSKEAFRAIDYDLPLSFARMVRQQGATSLALVSAVGSSPDSSFFYPRVKGELERDIQSLGFPSLTILRPGLIGGEREEHRLAEEIASRLSGFLAPVLPKSFRINPASKIAAALVSAVVEAAPGLHYLRSADLS